jgi:hypothetical protein
MIEILRKEWTPNEFLTHNIIPITKDKIDM